MVTAEAFRLYQAVAATVRETIPRDARWLRALFTGSREWANRRDDILPYLEAVLLAVAAGSPDGDRLTVVHGGAPGADRMILRLAHRYGMHQSVYPVDAHERIEYGDRAPLVRDERMVRHGAGIAIGVPYPNGRTGGTWTTLRLARAAGIPTFYLTNGTGGWRLAPFVTRARATGQMELFS